MSARDCHHAVNVKILLSIPAMSIAVVLTRLELCSDFLAPGKFILR
jgi:hypothetical protein